MRIKGSCPHGLTADDLAKLMTPAQLSRFSYWMRGQTVMLCEGRAYHYNRGPCFEEGPERPTGRRIPCPPHELYSDHTWLCDYPGGGEYVPDACAGNPHGMVTYAGDVERFLLGLPIID